MFLKGRGEGGRGGGHTLERMNPPPGRKKKSFSGKRRRGEGGLWLWFMTSKLSQKMFLVRVFQIPESPVLSRGMLMTSPAVISCRCPLSRLQRCAPWRKPTRQKRKSTQERCSGPRTEAGSATGGGCGEEARPGSRRGGGAGGSERGGGREVSRSQAAVN